MPSPAADRNLLFGILALQMDFVSRDALIAGMHAWVLDKTKPLGQILADQGALPRPPPRRYNASEHHRERQTAAMNNNLLQRVGLDPKVMAGKPVIRGTRIPVALL